MNDVSSPAEITFKIRFNTMHGDTCLYWRVIIDDEEYLAATVHCAVPTYSESSFDKHAGTIKWHMAGTCAEFYMDDAKNAFFK